MINKSMTRDKILEYYEQVLKKRQQKFTHNDDADKLIKQEPVAFLFAVILDQGAQAEKIWAIPYHLIGMSLLIHFETSSCCFDSCRNWIASALTHFWYSSSNSGTVI